MNAYLLHHRDDLAWVRQRHGADAQLIAHEDYLPILLGEAVPLFFDHHNFEDRTDEAINFLSFNWYRDEDGKENCEGDHFSVADAFSAGLLINISSVCREYFALKYWCSRYACVYISCNEPAAFLNIAKKFAPQVQVYDPGHRMVSPLCTLADRVLGMPPIDRRANFLRKLQTPFLRLLRNKTLALSDWTMSRFSARQQGWISVNSRWPWRGAYTRTLPPRCLLDAERHVPNDFEALLEPARLVDVLQRVNVHWDNELIEALSESMVGRYQLYRGYFVWTVAAYQDMLDSYKPAELVVGSEFYEPYLIAAHLAKTKGIKVSWLVDGYLIVDIEKRIGKASLGPAMFDRIYAIACQHERRILKSRLDVQEVVTVAPPILDNHVLKDNAPKTFDAIIMTWIPNDLGMDGRNGSRPNTLVDALRSATDAGFEKLAIKIKHHTEREWLLPILESTGYLDKVTLLEGPFSDHVASTRRIIGGISSAVAEATYHDIPYYIYEPLANGYSAAEIASAVIFAEGGVARTPAELDALLERPEGSVINDRALLFGTECPQLDWSWDQTRELYITWVAQWADRSGIKNALQWRGFPLWWASTLIAKDTAVDYVWYQALHERLCGLADKQLSPMSPLSHGTVYAGILKSLFKELGKWLLLRFLPKRPETGGERVWFHGLEYNLIHARGGFCDRMYEQVPLDDHKHGFTSAFIFRLNIKSADFLHPGLWRKKLTDYASRLQRDVEILDRYLFLADIIQIHASLIGNYFKFSKMAKRLQQQGVRVGHAEFSDILILEMQKSFMSMLPWSLTYAAMFERWLQSSGGDKALVTYGETLAPMRAVYFATKKNSPRHRWVSIQHATIYKNKMGFYHRYSEFNRSGLEDKRSISPMPDYYFVHGSQFADILSGFYPAGNIRITGCLKYDSLYRVYSQGRRLQSVPSDDRILLLAPSVGDEEIILKVLAGLRALPGWRVMLSKHPTVSQEWINELIRRNEIALEIGFDPSKSTVQLMESASLVVCSYSGIALESFFVGVPSVRVLNPEQPPMVEDEPGVDHVTTQQELLRVLSELDQVKAATGLAPEVSRTLKRYFYKFDGLAATRFWTELGQLGDLPRQQGMSG
ncbi:MAG: hypothetical protein PSV40_14975 [Polaromonas sp.]|uniref:hypothetical protein n=1 Tax=Polaromonas sp. TaxID=1869339 RepID=UPI0024885FBF|nr:hypothetical protein [Polaromonas sp.]MDI1270387.1 hypothetical protein [Polaromonas sp.]